MAGRFVILLTVLSSSQSQGQLSHIRVSIDNQISASSCEATLASLHTLLTGARTELMDKTNITTERVTISLPRSWSTSPCVQGLNLARASPGTTDLVVLPSPDTEIRTVQYGGCGVRGKRIILPHQRVENSQNVTRDVTDLFISLLKYEFGYFDTQAPPGSANEVKFPESNETSEMEAESCSRDPLNDKDYNTEAPTQQNLLCQEQSPLRVIKSGLISESEKSDVMAEPGRSPIVEYVISQKTRHLLVLDRSQQSKHVWKHLRNALYRLISTYPEYDEVAIITYGRYAETRLRPTSLTNLNRAGISSRLPGKLNQATVGCVLCAISEAASLISDSQDVETKVTIVNSSPVENKADLVKSLKSLGQQSEVTLMVTGNQWMLDQNSEQLAGINIFHVEEQERKSVTDLFEILSFGLESQQSFKFYSRQFSVKSNGGVSGKFVVEDSLREDMMVVASSLQQEDIEMFSLTSPSGVAHTFPVVERGQAHFSLSGGAEAGVWSYSARLTPSTLQPTVPLTLTARARPSQHTVSLEAWTQSHSSLTTPPVILARLTEAELPVLGADVVAEVRRPDGEMVEVVLHDSGNGYPDIQAGDGIYSGYLTDLSQLAGLYSIKISATNHRGLASVASAQPRLCGAEPSYTPALHFSRYTRAPSFFLGPPPTTFSIIEGVPVRKDAYPPARVTDVRLSGAGPELELSWTAPGGDLDKGRADSYQLRWSQNRKLLMEQFETDGNILDNSASLSPGYFGTTESLNITAPLLNTVIYIALVAEDEAGNTSPVSNIVRLMVEQELPAEDSLSKDLSQVSSLTLSDMSTTAWVYILSISLASVTLIIIMLLVIIIRRRRMRKLQENCPIPYFIELGPPAPGDKTDHQLISSPSRDYPDDTLSYPSPASHPVLELYHHHARQYQMYQNTGAQTNSDSGRSSSSSDNSDNSDRGSPGWQRTPATSGASATSGMSSSSSLRQSRRRRESFV